MICFSLSLSGQSLSSWRAWIEMMLIRLIIAVAPSRSPHGERGLKSCYAVNIPDGQVALLMESVD